ncbi:MAG: VWA domain-containing protein [Campylobacterota bacterium]|nr:VWA domain-containing protein [Campylobacterota bacterium]
MFDGLYFEFPKIAFVIGFFIACESLCRMRLSSIYFPHTAQFVKKTMVQSKLLFILKWLGIILLILALMSPVKDEEIMLDPEEGYDIALVLDVSQSMGAQGFDPSNPRANRFDAVKSIVADFVKERQNDNLGFVVFGQYSFVASPLTYDQEILTRVLEQLYIGMAGKYTALYEALAQSVNLLKGSKAKSKIAILLTDGHNTPGGKIPLDIAIELAKKEGVKVYPIGIGARGEYNAEVLNTIAQETGAEAFGAHSAGQLKEIYKKIDELEKSEIERESYSYLKYYYMYPLFLAFIFLLAFVYLRNKKGWL